MQLSKATMRDILKQAGINKPFRVIQEDIESDWIIIKCRGGKRTVISLDTKTFIIDLWTKQTKKARAFYNENRSKILEYHELTGESWMRFKAEFGDSMLPYWEAREYYNITKTPEQIEALKKRLAEYRKNKNKPV